MSDLRTKRTRASIKRAFMTLRAKKSLEKISVKELSELAEINKATFYLHYRDIYDLSDQVENELLEEGLRSLYVTEESLRDPASFVRQLIDLQEPFRDSIRIVFSGVRESVLPDKLEAMTKARLFAQMPELANNLYMDILLSYMIQGAYRAYNKYEQEDPVKVLSIVAEISHNLAELYRVQPLPDEKTAVGKG